MKEVTSILLFTLDPNLPQKISERTGIDPSKISLCRELKSAFDLLAERNFDALIFESYNQRDGQYIGLNETDLDLLLYYAHSEDSINRFMKFLPIDPIHSSESGPQNKSFAEELYPKLYERYLLLLPGIALNQLVYNSLFLSDEKKMLFDLINTLDSACDQIDGEQDNHFSSGSSSSEDLTTVKGQYPTNDENIRISGQKEEIKDSAHWIQDPDGSSKQHQKDEVQIVSGLSEDLQSHDDIYIIEGAAKESEEHFKIAGNSEESEELYKIKGSSEDENLSEKNQKTILKGNGEKITEGIMKVKSLGNTNDSHAFEFNGIKSLNSKSKPTTPVLDESWEESGDINHRNAQGQTPVMLYSYKGDKDKVMELIDKGADTSLKCKRGFTLLHYACSHKNNLSLVEYLVQVDKLKVTARNSDGFDSLAMAIQSDSSEIVKWLISQGARTNSKIKGLPLLHYAAQHNSFKSFLVLLSTGVELKTRSREGLTAEQFCKRKRKLPFVKALKAYEKLNHIKKAA